MNWLAVSTSSSIPSVAVKKAEGEIVIKQSTEGLTHSQTIMGLIDGALFDTGLVIDDIDCLAVDIGPGSFTGVRIGVSIINAIVDSNKTSLYAVSPLNALCYKYRYKADNVCALLDARHGNIYGALLCADETIPSFAATIDETVELCKTKHDMLFIGDGAAANRSALIEALPYARFIDTAIVVSAADILEYAQNNCDMTKCSKATPLYLRPSQAERLFTEK